MSITNQDTYAAIDLGSNSFHLLVATIKMGQLQQIDKVKQMVRLAAGLDKHKNISSEKLESAYQCLRMFAQRIHNIPEENIKIVGTNTLRIAKNADRFLNQAEQILGREVAIISGREEARMLYLGVAQTMSERMSKKLVMDIGGGSTEIIIGKGFEALKRESLHMGCVSFTQRYFGNGKINLKKWNKAHTQAMQELLPIAKSYRQKLWQHAIGASGTMRAAATILHHNELAQSGINYNGIEQLIERCLQHGSIEALQNLPGLSERRRPVFIGGLAIIKALMDTFSIEHINVSTGALREGLVYSMCGQEKNQQQVSRRAVQKLCSQFDIDGKQSQRVAANTQLLLSHWHQSLTAPDKLLLDNAIQLHELGLSIAHSQFNRHGAYIIKHADLPGFSRQQQRLISHLVYYHRRDLVSEKNTDLNPKQWHRVLPLLMILRLAVIFSRDRELRNPPIQQFSMHQDGFQLLIGHDWLHRHPLIQADLLEEAKYWQQIDIEFKLNMAANNEQA